MDERRAHKSMRSETILVVDDEPAVRELIRLILSRQGYKVLVADSGPKALEICRQADTAIDLLLTDVVMPGMSGLVLAQQLKAQEQNLPVLFITGGTLAPLVNIELDPKSALLLKPFDSQALVRSVRETLDAGRNGERSNCRETGGSRPSPL
jgi:two-component system, cell cycle sensor histidine kinase and response regulator CckA